MNNAKKSKKYYWIKLTADFLTSEKVDYLISQDGGNGFAYVVLYQCLCLKTVNSEGQLVTQLGEIMIPYNVAKLRRDLKWFSVEQLQRAFELFTKLGLIYTNEKGFIEIANFDRLIGSETYGAIEKREQRKRLPQSIDNGIDNVYADIRDKRLDIRDIDNRDIYVESTNVSSTNDKTRYNEIKANGFAGELFLKLVESEYVSLYELDTNDYIKFLKQLLDQWEVVDVKIKVEYFIRVTCHYVQVGTDKQDKPIFGYRYRDEKQIANKFSYFTTTILNAFEPKEYLTEEQQKELQKIIDEMKDDEIPFL